MTLCWLVGVWLLQPSSWLSQPRNLVVYISKTWLFHGCYQVAACYQVATRLFHQPQLIYNSKQVVVALIIPRHNGIK